MNTAAAETPKVWALAIAQAERTFNEIAVADGNLVTYQREASYALQAIQASDWLQKCTAESLRNAVVNVASVGLSLSPPLKLAYLVPRDGKACLDISYIGLVKIATDSGSVLAAKAEIVRANDEFEYVDGFTPPRHKFNPFAKAADRGEIIGVYAQAKLHSGITLVEPLGMEEIAKIRAVSKAKSGPWTDWFEEMAKKSAIKRASKMWPRTERLSKAVAVLDQHEGNVHQLGPATPIEPNLMDVDAAKAALAAAAERKERLVKSANEATDKDALAVVWKTGLAEVRQSKDHDAYEVFKTAVEARMNAFASGAAKPAGEGSAAPESPPEPGSAG